MTSLVIPDRIFGRLDWRNGEWIVAGLPPHVSLKFKSMFASVPKTKAGEFTITDNPSIAADLLWFMQRYPLGLLGDARDRLDRSYQRALDQLEFTQKVMAEDWVPSQLPAFRPETPPYPFQAQGAAKAVAALVRLLVKSGEKVLLAGWHRDVYDVWLAELRDLFPVMYTGSESSKAKTKAKRAFMDGTARVMIISLRSGAGLDGLQHTCSKVVFGEFDWSPQVHKQVIGRLRRPGQLGQVDAIYAHTNGGSDPVIIEMLGLKSSQSQGITDPFSGTVQQHSDDSRIKRLAEAYLSRSEVAAE